MRESHSCAPGTPTASVVALPRIAPSKPSKSAIAELEGVRNLVELAHRQIAHGLDVGDMDIHRFDATGNFLGFGVLVCDLNGFDQTFLYPSLDAFGDSPQRRILTIAGDTGNNLPTGLPMVSRSR